jgi:ribonuclease BN (tRNA processing enzyme)
MPNVIVLGGASAVPNPGQGCSGYLVSVDHARLVLDLGAGTLPELRRHCAIGSIDGIIITHLHVDHMLDLVALWWGWLYHPVPLARPIPLWLPPGGIDRVTRILATFGRADEVAEFFTRICSVTEFDPEQKIQIAGATVNFAATAHFIPCWAIRVESAQGAVAYTADTGPAANLVAIAHDAEVLIAEAMLPSGSFDESPNRGSSTATEAAQLAQNSGAKRLILTHLWAEHDADASRTEAARVFTGPIEIARPGLTVRW